MGFMSGISLGAQRVDWEYPDDADSIVLADPRRKSVLSHRLSHQMVARTLIG